MYGTCGSSILYFIQLSIQHSQLTLQVADQGILGPTNLINGIYAADLAVCLLPDSCCCCCCQGFPPGRSTVVG